MKRVATLYRVSTKKQSDHEDIPLQKRSCRGFIDDNSDWKLVKEYYEVVSGFKVSADDRDVIQQAKEDAEKGLFDVLLVFKFDRLGRKDDETPFVLEWFVEHGIEMWSVTEGQQKIEQHTDRLVNYLRFWQSSGESRNTSIRVDEKHKQMIEDGIFRGGFIAYGYKTIPSGTFNKKGKELLKMVLDEIEAPIAAKIFDMVYSEGLGQLRIAQYLNGEGYLTKNGRKWTASAINAILKNPIYKGVMRYRKDNGEEYYSPVIPWLVIIPEHKWDYVQEMRKKRSPKKYAENNTSIPMSTKSPCLLVGMARCGVCGSRMTTTTFSKKKVVNGETVRIVSAPSYRCTGKLEGAVKCNGQATFSSTYIDKEVSEEVLLYMERLKKIDFTSKIESIKENSVGSNKKELNRLQKLIETQYDELSALKEEVVKVVLGKSSFSADLLNELIAKKENEISDTSNKMSVIEDEMKSNKNQISDLSELNSYLTDWRDTFYKASSEKKKIMLSKVVDTIYISKDNIDIKMNVTIDKLMACETSQSGRALLLLSQVKELLQASLQIEYSNPNKKRRASA